jgi:ubiquinone biosynthesis protein UbiJ
MAVFEIVRTVLHRTSYIFTLIMKGMLHQVKLVHENLWLLAGKVSLDRFSSFLRDTELLDSFSEQKVEVMSGAQHEVDDRIGFNNAIFSWSNDTEDGAQTPSSRGFRLRVEGNITFKRNCINLIIGPT